MFLESLVRKEVKNYLLEEETEDNLPIDPKLQKTN